MRDGEVVGTKNPTGHSLLVDCRFELPFGKKDDHNPEYHSFTSQCYPSRAVSFFSLEDAQVTERVFCCRKMMLWGSENSFKIELTQAMVNQF
jgi:hypothetical protein